MSNPAPWLDLALAELGTAETPGPRHTPAVLNYFRDAGRPDIKDDETAWCAAATGSWLKRSGLPIPAPNVALLARSYVTYGVECEPEPGAIGIWPRGTADWQGHVAIVVDVDRKAGTCRCIGGNQDNAVSVQVFRLDSALAFRWPVDPTVRGLRRAGSTEVKTADKIEAVGVVGTVAAVGTAVAVEAIKAPDPVATAPPPVPVIDPGTLTTLEQVTAAGKAIGALVVAHPWLGGCVVACLALLWLGRRMKARRVAKAAAGVPLGVEVQSR